MRVQVKARSLIQMNNQVSDSFNFVPTWDLLYQRAETSQQTGWRTMQYHQHSNRADSSNFDSYLLFKNLASQKKEKEARFSINTFFKKLFNNEQQQQQQQNLSSFDIQLEHQNSSPPMM
jgi:hypothetical protein